MNSSLQERLIIGKCWIINPRDKSMCSFLVVDPGKLGWADPRSEMRGGGKLELSLVALMLVLEFHTFFCTHLLPGWKTYKTLRN